MAPKRLTPNDAVFLFGESRDTMMHVAGLLPFSPAEDAPPDFLRRLVDDIKASRDVQPPFNQKLWTPEWLKNPVQAWVEDRDLDIDYHVRRSALPAPGDERELGVLVSRLHSHPVDFHKPPWEVHLIEGLEGGRFALYCKVHHSLVDGFTAMRILKRTLSASPEDRDQPMFFAVPPTHRAREADELEPPPADVFEVLRHQLRVVKDMGSSLLDALQAGFKKDGSFEQPLRAPQCILNGRISRNRRFATQQLELERLKVVAKTAGCTLNDVVLALSAGSLRRFLLEMNALPDAPLIAMLPVNARPKDDPGGGNAVGTILASLATHVADPAARLAEIVASTRRAKAELQGLSTNAIIQLSMLMMAPFALQMVTGTIGRLRPAFNVVISNVPGPERPLYFRGARLEASYPMSIPVHGLALNITCQSYAGTLNFGFIGCRDTLPHMQHLAVYCGEALTELEIALGCKGS